MQLTVVYPKGSWHPPSDPLSCAWRSG